MSKPVVRSVSESSNHWLIHTPYSSPYGEYYRLTLVTRLKQGLVCSWHPEGRCEHIRFVAQHLNEIGESA